MCSKTAFLPAIGLTCNTSRLKIFWYDTILISWVSSLHYILRWEICSYLIPSRGNLPSGNQLGKEAQNQLSNAADQYGNPWSGTPANQAQGPQWANNNIQPNSITITITDPEDQKWLAQTASSGFDPASVITTCRQRQQQHSRSSAPSNNSSQPAPKVSSVLPSGLVACNECAHLSATLEQSDDHYDANHSHLAGRPDGRK